MKTTKGEDKRQRIFVKYKNNLNLLVNNAFIKNEIDVYICPMCLKVHQTINEKDPLTLEDAPPKSLGGTANTLTCKSCNNTAGHKIDFHLTERLNEIDSKNCQHHIPRVYSDLTIQQLTSNCFAASISHARFRKRYL